MRNKITKFLSILVFALALFFVGSLKNSSVINADGNVEVHITVKKQGVTAPNQQITAISYETVYQKIKYGKFSHGDFNNPAWVAVGKQFTTTNHGHVILLPEGLKMGAGIRHSQADTLDIIKLLYKSGNIGFLQLFNGSPMPGINPDGLPNETYFAQTLHGSRFTDSKGHAVASIPAGATLIRNSKKGEFLSVVYLQGRKENLAVELVNNDPQLKTSITNLSQQSKNGSNYTVGYGQKIKYRIKIDPTLSADGGTLTIKPDSNIAVNEISAPYIKKYEISSNLNLKSYVDNVNPANVDNESIDTYAEMVGKKLIGKPFAEYNVQVAPGTEYVTVTAHYEPQVTITRNIVVAGNRFANIKIPISIENEQEKKMKLEATFNGQGETVTSYAETVNTTGINFVMANINKPTLVKGAQFNLYRDWRGHRYFLDKNDHWTRISVGRLSANTEAKVLKGGRIYQVGTNKSEVIPLNTSQYGFNPKENTDQNKSLIQLRGLMQGPRYFLYQTKPAHNATITKRKFRFNVFSNSFYSPDGAHLTTNSINESRNSNGTLNGMIPDYSTENMEYHVLNVVGSHDHEISPIFRTVGFITIMVIGILIVVSVLLFRFK